MVRHDYRFTSLAVSCCLLFLLAACAPLGPPIQDQLQHRALLPHQRLAALLSHQRLVALLLH